MSGVCVIVAYRPKPGKEKELLDLVRSRVPTLRKEGLVTDRVPTIVRAKDGTIIEVSEWQSQEAIDAAHKNKNVWRCGTNFLNCAIVFHSRRWRKPRRCSQTSSRWNRYRDTLGVDHVAADIDQIRLNDRVTGCRRRLLAWRSAGAGRRSGGRGRFR